MVNFIYKRLTLLLVFSTLLFFSCSDIFHFVGDIINSANEPSIEPRRIFVGGNFYYEIDGFGREAFLVLNGQGNFDWDFLSKNNGIVLGSPMAPILGVQDIELTDSYVYVGGNFMGYDTNNDEIANTQYQMVQRYSLDGDFDTSYIPFGVIPGDVQLYSIEPLDDGSLLAGGNFGPYTAPNYYGETELIQFTPDGNGSISTYPSAPDGSFVYSLESIFEGTKLAVGGTLNNLGSEIGLSNFGIVDSGAVVPASSLDLGNFPATTEVRDFASWNDTLYIVANETAMLEGILFKYTYNGSSFIADTVFNSAFDNLINDNTTNYPTSYFNRLNTVAVDELGRLYIGGQFYEIYDSMNKQHNYIMRVTADGQIDSSFNANMQGSEVNAIEIQKNGKILVGGNFFELNGDTGFNGFARLQESGYIDYDFDRGSFPGGTIYAIAIEEEPDPEP